MEHRVFGAPEPGATYRNRPAAYGIAFDDVGRAAVVRCEGYGCFLLGGGIEPDESEAECICREALEEIGYSLTVGEKVCSSEGYVNARKTGEYIHPIQHVYLVQLGEQVAQPVEPDHVLTWVPVEEFRRNTFLEYQSWAMEMAWDAYQTMRKEEHS